MPAAALCKFASMAHSKQRCVSAFLLSRAFGVSNRSTTTQTELPFDCEEQLRSGCAFTTSALIASGLNTVTSPRRFVAVISFVISCRPRTLISMPREAGSRSAASLAPGACSWGWADVSGPQLVLKTQAHSGQTAPMPAMGAETTTAPFRSGGRVPVETFSERNGPRNRSGPAASRQQQKKVRTPRKWRTKCISCSGLAAYSRDLSSGLQPLRGSAESDTSRLDGEGCGLRVECARVCWGGGKGGGRRRAVTCLSEHDGAAEHRPCEELRERPPLGGHAVATRRGRGRKFSERKRKAERKI